MLIRYLIVVLSAFVFGWASNFLLKMFSQRYKLLASKGIPLVGGIGILLSLVLSCSVSFYFLGQVPPEIKAIIISSLLIFFFGIIDDLRELSVALKLLAQVAATVLLIILGVHTRIAGIGFIANIAVTFFWVVGITNAFNLLDVMDGLAAGTAVIIAAAFFFVAAITGNAPIAYFSSALIGAALGFLMYNFPPAKIYMGNSGSHFLGFIFAAVALAVSYATAERKLALASPVLILGFPIFDMLFLILMRLRQKRSIFRKSRDHLVLRFLNAGYSKNKALIFMLMLCLFFTVSGVLTSQSTNLWGGAVIVIALATGAMVARKMSGVKVEK